MPCTLHRTVRHHNALSRRPHGQRCYHANLSERASVRQSRRRYRTHLYSYGRQFRSFSTSSRSHHPFRSGHLPSSSSFVSPALCSRARYSCATATGGLSRGYPAARSRHSGCTHSRRSCRHRSMKALGHGCVASCHCPFRVRLSTATPCMGYAGFHRAGHHPSLGSYGALYHQNGRGNPGSSCTSSGPLWHSKCRVWCRPAQCRFSHSHSRPK